MRLRPLGIRPKLTLTAIGLITILYVLLGAGVQFAARRAILGSIDSSLREMAAGFGKSHRPPPPGDQGPGNPPPDDGFGPPGPDLGFGRPGDGPMDGPPPDDPGTRRLEPRVEDPDIHETRPQLVWRERGVRLPFPMAKPTDVDATLDARHGTTTLRTITYDGQPIRVITVPMRNHEDHHVEAVAQINYWLGDIYKTLDSLTGTLFLILPLGILLMGAASTYVVGKTLQPIRDMTSAAAKIEAENLAGRLDVVGQDEFSELAETMNGMFGRLDVSFHAQRRSLEQLQEVLLQQRRFTADASHELKTPLAVVKVNASLLKSHLNNQPEVLDSVDAIDQAVNRMAKLVQDLLLLARTDAGQLAEQFTEVDLISTADQAASLVPCAKRIDLTAPNEPLVVEGSQFAVERLLTNILDNACRHSETNTRVQLKISKRENLAVIQIVDHGEGIPQKHLPKIFDRFHRVDGSRHSGTGGAGLGLAISKGIVDAHKGKISVESKVDSGTTFTIELPLVTD